MRSSRRAISSLDNAGEDIRRSERCREMRTMAVIITAAPHMMTARKTIGGTAFVTSRYACIHLRCKPARRFASGRVTLERALRLLVPRIQLQRLLEGAARLGVLPLMLEQLSEPQIGAGAHRRRCILRRRRRS
jgi:hypothetical protein